MRSHQEIGGAYQPSHKMTGVPSAVTLVRTRVSRSTVLRCDAESLGTPVAGFAEDAATRSIEFVEFSELRCEEAHQMIPDHVNPLQWHQALGFARQACARVYRDGGSPPDALRAFGLVVEKSAASDWSKTVDKIAMHLCAAPTRRAA